MTCTTLLRRLQAEQTAGRKVLAAPDRTEISHSCSVFCLLPFTFRTQSRSQSLLAMPFHQAQGCVNLPAQRLHAVFKPSHSLAKPVIAIPAMSKGQKTGTATASRHLERQRDTTHQRTLCQSSSEIRFPAPVQELIFVHHST